MQSWSPQVQSLTPVEADSLSGRLEEKQPLESPLFEPGTDSQIVLPAIWKSSVFQRLCLVAGVCT